MVESLLSPVIEKLIDLLIKEAKSLKGVHKQVKSLQKELEIIEPLLHDAEAKSSRGELSNATKVWMRQLKEEADRIEDIIDEYTYHIEQRRHEEVGFARSLHKASQCVKSFKTRRDLASEIRDVEESLREIKERGLSYGLRPFEQGGSSCNEGTLLVDPRIGSLFIDDDELVGIESVSNELVRSLVEGRPERTVISLVGEGGIGKTTLARKVYNDVVEKGSFDHAVWVTISQSYDINKILKMLMNRICPPVREIIAVEEAFTLLRSSLQAKRYVIVFDDVWQTDLWNVVKHALPNDNNGSRILLTTRKSTVIESFKSPSTEIIVRKLKTWSSEQAWELFCIKAFPSSDCPAELEELSHEILKKCQGVPLAVVAVAGLLSRKEKSKVEWKKVLTSLKYEFEEHNGLGNVSKILLLSYHDLPYHLKPCFLYFGIYPEDYSVMDRRLLKIWIAEGFVKPKQDTTLEQIADEYLTDLISRNLVSSELLYGFGRWCKVHDLIRELILSKASDIGFFKIFNRSKSSYKEKSRRLIIYDTTENVFKATGDSKIRSVVLFNVKKLSASFVIGVFESCKLLKVVDFYEAPLDYLPKEVGNLMHLKYLNLSGTKVKTLPKSIGKLQNLQSLNVRCTLVRELPVEINKLKKLRHISADSFDDVAEYSVSSYIGVKMHKGIERLEDLQTLHTVEAHSGGVDFVRELQKHSKLKCLGISKVTAEMCEALGESIEEMNNLEHLFLISINEEEVLDLKYCSSAPILLRSIRLICRLRKLPTWVSEHQYLQGLELNFSRLVDEPLKRLKDLPNLSYLRLHKAYEGEELHFGKGSFPKLKLLHLEYMEGLNAVKIEIGSLPLLERLKFGGFPLMKEMPCDLRHLTNLKFLWILDMPREFVKALQPKGGSEFCKIQHISSVIFGYYTGKGCSYAWLKLGSSELLQHLEKQQ